MNIPSKHTLTAAATMAIFALAPGTADAQEAQPQQSACSAEVAPKTLKAGQSAVQVAAEFSQPVGGITAIRPASESGLNVAAPGDLPKSDMAAEGEQPRPVSMANNGTTLEVWLNTESAQPGTYQIAFHGENARCTGEITVEEGGGSG